MAEQQKQTFPNIPVKHWWTLRERFQQSIPAAVTPSFVATTLDMQEGSARTNIIPSLVTMGIIDQDGKPTPRAREWRDNEQYREVCLAIRNEVYPRELLDVAPDSPIDRSAVERWFANTTGVGQVGAKRFAAVYEILTTSELPEKKQASAKPASGRTKTKPQRRGRVEPPGPVEPLSKDQARKLLGISDLTPSIHIDIQIHIPPEAGPDQIDQIFASMAKHFRRLTAPDE